MKVYLSKDAEEEHQKQENFVKALEKAENSQFISDMTDEISEMVAGVELENLKWLWKNKDKIIRNRKLIDLIA